MLLKVNFRHQTPGCVLCPVQHTRPRRAQPSLQYTSAEGDAPQMQPLLSATYSETANASPTTAGHHCRRLSSSAQPQQAWRNLRQIQLPDRQSRRSEQPRSACTPGKQIAHFCSTGLCVTYMMYAGTRLGCFKPLIDLQSDRLRHPNSGMCLTATPCAAQGRAALGEVRSPELWVPGAECSPTDARRGVCLLDAAADADMAHSVHMRHDDCVDSILQLR